MIGKVFSVKGRPLDEEKIRKLAEIAQEADFPSGAVIQDIGLEQRYVYLIIEGVARSYYIDRDGSDITKMFMREYEFAVGESLFLTESLEVFETLEKLKSIRFEFYLIRHCSCFIPKCWNRRLFIKCAVNTAFRTCRPWNDIFSFGRSTVILKKECPRV